MTLRVIIADDEPLARERLRHLLAPEADLEVVAECRNGRETIAALREKTADLLLLDIQMPGKDGFAVISEVGTANLPVTIFVTAHDQYAIDAFEVHALDYLTKPVEPKRLGSALARGREQVAARQALRDRQQWGAAMESMIANVAKRTEHPDRLLVPHGTRDVLVTVSEIEWIDAANYYACLHVGQRCLMIRKSIKELAVMLDPASFVRVHRSVIVNLAFVREICRDGRTDGFVLMAGGQQLRLSAAGWQALMHAHRPGKHA